MASEKLPSEILMENFDEVKYLSEELGYTAREIGAEFGTTKSTVLRFLIQHKIKRNQWGGSHGGTQIPEIEVRQAMFLREHCNWTMDEIGIAMGLTRSSVKNRLRIGGIIDIRKDSVERGVKHRKIPPPKDMIIKRSDDDVTIKRQEAFKKRYAN